MNNPGQSDRPPLLPFVFAMALSLPLLLPIPGLESVPPFAMAAALLSIPLLFMQLCLDGVMHRRGSMLRIVVLLMVAAGLASWSAGVVAFGADAGAALSCANWIALAALVVAGQTFLGSPRRIEWMLNTWVWSYSVIVLLVLAYLVGNFGAQVVSTTDRAPFQIALRGVIPSWPNYFGVAIVIAVCIAYGRILTGAKGPVVRAQLVLLLLGLIVTFSRGSYLACIAGLTAMTVVTRSKRRALLVLTGVGVLAVLLGAIFPAVSFQLLATFERDTSQSLGLLERLAFAREALLVWWERPAFGVGFFQFTKFVDPSQVYSGVARPDLGSIHNEYITTLLKSGWVGALSLLLFLAVAFRLLRRAAKQTHDHRLRQSGVIALGIAAALLTAGLALESLRTISVSGIFWALVGALDVSLRRSESAKCTAGEPRE